jgi:hypothetical protein
MPQTIYLDQDALINLYQEVVKTPGFEARTAPPQTDEARK